MGRRRYIYIIREPSTVDHIATRQCRGYEYQPERDAELDDVELDWISGDTSKLCPKCRWFAVRYMPYGEKPEAGSIALQQHVVTLREPSDWWIGNHIEYIGKKDYRYNQNDNWVTEISLSNLTETLEEMRAQGTPIRPSDIEQWHDSQELVDSIRETLKQEEGLRILIDMDRF
jgi:hypothetical protein